MLPQGADDECSNPRGQEVLAWLAIWSLSAWGLAVRRRAAPFPLWFLGIAGLANGVAHPALSVLSGGYFPGLVTSPVFGLAGVLLLRRLLLVTGVFLALHTHEFEDGHEDVKVIGVFSSREKAEAVVSRLRREAGFRDHPAGFVTLE